MTRTTRTLLYATTNPGKAMEIRALLGTFGLDVTTPADLGLALDVPETGDTLDANATLKARAYLDHLDGEYVVIGDDTGVEIDALDGEPGIRVRRWDGSARMSDQAVLDYCLNRLRGVPPDQRGAQFRTTFAVAAPGLPVELFYGTLRGLILEKPAPLRIEGFPFESIFYVPEWGKLLGEIHSLPPEQKRQYVTHRERALWPALPRLRELLAGEGNNVP
ncbi:MAG: non-canonical purine NTP pyrophosphatase [Anaerolineae bacterium]|nr:non-canonical purine NTP pyrophosphatase [Anaerolineae bacterium]